jgi:hypothetical protein
MCRDALLRSCPLATDGTGGSHLLELLEGREGQARGREIIPAGDDRAGSAETVHRSVEVVATLAAQDGVTISSQAEDASADLADLGDRVHASDVIELDREKLR